ncbi:LysM peptidoglycan-binding domain-containing protein [Paenarthrobacter sp. NyZ202]|uniref:LysM peptidoglycan-binding domain-containing protein n=1 Tax=Paenarthrobacter sp. NyZ202 TaxID=3402689 RepID=UPI003CF493D7
MRRAMPVHRDAAMAGTVLLLGILLAAAGRMLLGRSGMMEHRNDIPFDQLLGVVASLTGVIIVVWWLLSFTLALVAALLHRKGRAGTAAAKFSPAFMLRLAVALVGLNLAGPPAAAIAATAPEPAWHPQPHTSASVAWQPGIGPEATSTSPLNQDDARQSLPTVPLPGWKPDRIVEETGLLSRTGSRAAEPGTVGRSGVVVREGDSLWTLASAHLGPLATDAEVALHWPKWFAANRSIIGDDPTKLLPGQVLQPPSLS